MQQSLYSSIRWSVAVQLGVPGRPSITPSSPLWFNRTGIIYSCIRMMEWCGGLLDTLHEYTVPSQPVFSVPGNFKVLRVWARKDSFTVYLESTNPRIGIQRYFEHQTRKDRFQVPNMNDCYTCTENMGSAFLRALSDTFYIWTIFNPKLQNC